MTSYHEQPGADNDDTREYLRLAHEAHTMHSLPAARAMTRFWSEHVSTSDGTQFTVTHVEPVKCTMNVLGTHWTVCGAPSDGPCYCDVTVVASPPGFPDEENPPPECTACRTNDYVMKPTHPGLCLGCSNARFWGFSSRLEAEPLAWVLPVPVLYCPSCLCVADQVSPDAWRCRNEVCGSVARLDDLLTTSELIKRRAALGRIKCAVMQRLTCTNCGGFHSVQKCPELFETLFIAPPDAALGRDLCAMNWKDASFLNMLINAEPPRLLHYAESYVAFLRATSPHTTLTVKQLLVRWQRETDPEPTPVAMQAAA